MFHDSLKMMLNPRTLINILFPNIIVRPHFTYIAYS